MSEQTAWTDPTEILNALLGAVRPIVEAADVLAWPVAAAQTVCVISPSPLAVNVLHRDVDGRVRGVHRQTGDAALADAMGTLVTAGLEQLPRAAGVRALALVNQGQAELVVLVDPDMGLARVALLPRAVDVAQMVDATIVLFELRGVPTFH
ncbi:MAG TPA: hypothetical protein VIX73_37680 [Kofleriaceae bacterium]